MNKTIISIIIPIYNVERYLKECLNSVINQTFKNIEIICVNDGSTDNSQSILEEFSQKDSRIIVINKKNGGYASAINTGLKIAQGEFIQFIESDDYCAKTMCEDLYNKISHTDADIVTADFYFLNKNKTKICNYLNKTEQNIDFFNIKSLPYIIAKQAYPWKSLYRKKFLDENNIKMPEDGNGAYEDQPWNATVLSFANKILYVNKPLYYYRLDANGSSTNNGKKSLINYIKRKRQTKEILEQNNLFYDDIKEYYSNSAVGGCLFFFKRISFEFKEEYYNEMKGFFQEINNFDLNFEKFSNKNKRNFDKILKNNYKNFYWSSILKHKVINIFNNKR